jgi:DNA primase
MVMEGYTDCIMAQQFGFHDAVAVLGTALGEGHIRILKRFADKILLVLDGDDAGQRRANEVLELFVAQQVDLKIVTLPEELDPCEFLLEHGAAAFAELLKTRAVDALEHAFLSATRGVDLERDVHGATQAMEKLLRVLARAPQGRSDAPQEFRLREEKMLQRMATRFRVDEREIRKRLTEVRRGAKPGPAPVRATPQADEALVVEANIDSFERELLETLLAHPDLLARVRDAIRPEQIASAACRRIYETMQRLADEGQAPVFDRLMLEFEQPALKGLLVELDEQAQQKAARVDDPTTMLEHLLRAFDTRDFEKRRPSQVVALREGNLDPEQQTQELQKILEEMRLRQGRSRPTDG